MATVALHTISILDGTVSKKWLAINQDTVFQSVSAALPTSISGNTQMVNRGTRDGGKSYRLLETPFQVDALRQLSEAIGVGGSLTAATLNMYDTTALALAHAAVGTTQGGGAITAGVVFVNVSTATATTVIAVTLPTAAANTVTVIKNPNTFALSVFPPTSGYINAGAINTAYTLAAGASVSFYTKSDGATSKIYFTI